MVEVKRISQLDWEFAPLKPDSQSASIELMSCCINSRKTPTTAQRD